jgi:PAS domain S-box-containing protein
MVFPYTPAALNWIALALLGPVFALSVGHLRWLRDRNRAIGRELLNFKLIGDHATDWNLLLDDSLRIRYVNLRAATDLGWSGDELHGRSIDVLVPEAHHAVLRAAIDAAGSGAAKPVEIAFARHAGVPAEMEVSCSAVDTEQGHVTHIAARDVAERKELARKLAELRHWESLRTLAGGLAHEFNNQFTGILGNASLAKQTLPPGHESVWMLDAVIASSQRSAELVQMMLATAGYMPRAKARLDLAEVMDSALRNRKLPDGVRIVKDAGEVTALGDRATFETLFRNLISNAAEAYGEAGGEISVAIRRSHPPSPVPNALVVEDGAAGSGECVGIIVEDHAGGMTREVIDHAFEPFYTTKFAGRGLGLPAVRGIVRAHSGKLILATAVGHGTRVEVWLPHWDKLD